jgi:aminoglycoside phosphotransferase family enzyme/predicted kinase
MTAGPGAVAPSAKAVDDWLRRGAGADEPCERVTETSISRLFFFRDRVLKLKKPVDFGFVDFTSAERRGWAAGREVAFNSLTAPDVYRGIVTIGEGPDGGVGAGGEPVDYAVEMRRFDEGAILTRRLPLDGAFAEDLGRRIARFHACAAPGTAGAGAAGLSYVVRSNADQLRACAGDLVDAPPVESLIARTWSALDAVRDLLDERAAQGFCRACHGDLHLSNIFVEHGAPVLFDCIEFSDALREIDVGYDIAFLLMDLAFRGDAVGANRAFNGWLDEGARHFPSSLWRGLAAMPLFQSVRAGVRGHVSAREAKPQEACRYLRAAHAWLEPQAPRLIAVGGLSGSGKTTQARSLAPTVGGPPGAVVLRSDEIRKRLRGVAPTDRLGPDAYDAAASAAVYAELERTAAQVLGAGLSVIADAAFLDPGRRGGIEAVAARVGAQFEGFWMEAAPDALRARLAARRQDASDADVRVLERQLVTDLGPLAWRRTTSGAEA